MNIVKVFKNMIFLILIVHPQLVNLSMKIEKLRTHLKIVEILKKR